MTRVMRDSTTAADIPADTPMVAGYVDGQYAWSGADWARFPSAVHVGIAVSAWDNLGDVLDVETGDATPEQAPGWVNRRLQAGASRCCLYVNRGNLQAVDQALHDAGIDTAHACLWVATLDGTEDTGSSPSGYPIVACQSKGTAQTGAHYDESVVYDDAWPEGVSVPPPAITATDYPEDHMHSYRDTVRTGNGFGWAPVPDGVDPAKIVNVVVDTQRPDEPGVGYVKVPVFVGVATGPNTVGGGPELVFEPPAGGAEPDAVYGFVLWAVD